MVGLWVAELLDVNEVGICVVGKFVGSVEGAPLGISVMGKYVGISLEGMLIVGKLVVGVLVLYPQLPVIHQAKQTVNFHNNKLHLYTFATRTSRRSCVVHVIQGSCSLLVEDWTETQMTYINDTIITTFTPKLLPTQAYFVCQQRATCRLKPQQSTNTTPQLHKGTSPSHM